jgi:Dolichyl-phosphate-mannose-protein mannosyltransferase/PilZ domain
MNQLENTPENSRRALRIFWIGLAILTVLRGVLNGVMPLTGEEAYYWIYSQDLQLCYFDHPPMVAYFIRAFTTIFGDTAFGVRMAALFCHTLTAIITFQCVRRITRDNIMAAFAGGAFAVSMFFAGMATLIIPDTVLFLFWAATIWFAIEGLNPKRRWMFVPAGICLGLAGLSKFHAVLLALAIGVTLLNSKRRWQYLRSPWFWMMVILGGALVMPVFIWQRAEGWPTFAYQLSSRHKAGNPIYPIEMIISPLVYIGPILYPLAWAGFLWARKKGFAEGRDDLALLATAFILPFAFFIILSLGMRMDSQWAAPTFVSGVMLAAIVGVRWARDMKAPRLLVTGVKINAALLGLAFVLVPMILILPNIIPRDINILGYRKNISTKRLGRVYGWEEIGERLAKEIDILGGPDKAFFHGVKGFGTLASMQFYAGKGIRAYQFANPPPGAKHYFMLAKKAELQGQNAIIIVRKERHFDRWNLRHSYERLEQIDDLVIERGGQVQQRFFLMRGYGFKQRPYWDRLDRSPRPGPKPKEVSPMEEQRYFTRVPFKTDAWITVDGKRFDGELLDICLKGALMSLTPAPVIGTDATCQISIRLPSSEVVLECEAVIVHKHQPFLGLEFKGMDDDTMTHLRMLMDLNTGEPGRIDKELRFWLPQE